MRTCVSCKETKPLSKFEKTDRYKQWYRKECIDCRRAYKIEWRRDSRAKVKKSTQSAIEAASQWNKEHPERHRALSLEYYYRLQQAAFAAYGGSRCACCGETEPMFMTLDHVNNDGSKHRMSNGDGRGAKLYKWLRDHKYPVGFQVLCMNCNHGKHRNGGICPHQEGVETIPSGK